MEELSEPHLCQLRLSLSAAASGSRVGCREQRSAGRCSRQQPWHPGDHCGGVWGGGPGRKEGNRQVKGSKSGGKERGERREKRGRRGRQGEREEVGREVLTRFG